MEPEETRKDTVDSVDEESDPEEIILETKKDKHQKSSKTADMSQYEHISK